MALPGVTTTVRDKFGYDPLDDLKQLIGMPQMELPHFCARMETAIKALQYNLNDMRQKYTVLQKDHDRLDRYTTLLEEKLKLV
jgi:hypothetical protein